MKKSILILFFGIAALATHAQEKPLAKIHYEFKHVNDTAQRDKFMRDELVNYLGKESSYYTSYSGTRMQEDMSKQLSNPAFDGNLVISRNSSPTLDSYFLDLRNKKFERVLKIGRDEFSMQEDFPHQDWEIGDETKEIGGYTCQKATTTFKGRNYTAWFALDIPMSYGPWKLHGLPGLILSAYDDKNEVSFEYSGFDKMDGTTNIVIGVPEKAIASTKSEVEKLEKAFKENPMAFMQAKSSGGGAATTVISSGRSAGTGTSASITFRGVSSGSGSSVGGMDPSKIKSMSIKNDENYKPSNVINNPIELTP